MRDRILAPAAGLAFAALAAGSAPMPAQETAPLAPLEALQFAQMKDAKAERVSSSSPNPGSNNDSWTPIPGETVVLADLKGPGVVTHIWLTIAANEYAWPRLLRLRVYYDGNPEASVDAPVGDFFAVGHGFERWVKSEMIRNSSEGRARNARPRDGLGRPLPYGAEGVPRQPEGIVRAPQESVAEAQELLDAGRSASEPGEER